MATRKILSTARNSRRLKKKDFKIELESHVAREVGAVIYLCLAAVFYLIINQKAGFLGEYINTYLRMLFGIGTLGLPILFLLLAATLFISRRIRMDSTRYLGIFLLIFSGLGLVHMQTPMDAMLDNVQQFGGYTGFLASVLLRIFISDTATRVILMGVLLIAVLITFEVSIRNLFSFILPDRQIKVSTKDSAKKTPLLRKGEEELNIVKPQLNKIKPTQQSGGEPEMKVKDIQPIAINKPIPIKKQPERKIH
jgi:hypothetical protein